MNNLDLLIKKNLLDLDNHMEYFFVQIFQRRKDNPDLELGVKRIKSYCVYSVEELQLLMPRIIRYCEDFNARAYIRLNKQNANDVTLRCIEQLTKNLRTGNFKKGRNVWDAISGQGGSRDWWILDIDAEHFEENMLIVPEIRSILQHHFEVERKLKFESTKIDTKTGVHLVVRPFDARILETINRQFQQKKIPNIQIQKDANTLLYTI